MDAKTENKAATDDRELVITRIFDAPRDLVFRAWTEEAHARNWGGPRDYPAKHTEADVRPGGLWRTCLRAADGSRDLWQGGVYREVVEPERLVFTFAWDQEDGTPGPETLVTIDFAEHDGRTKMTFRQAVFDTKSNRDGHNLGWNSAFDRLQEYIGEYAA
jgi:uncharacterized protein YndB with AHSA1/START domain